MHSTVRSVIVTIVCLCILNLNVDCSTAAPVDKMESTQLQQQQQHQQQQDAVKIIKYDNFNIGIDGYDFAFETSDGVSRKETATVKNIGTEEEAISVEGTVSWVGPDGIHYTLNYLADENGFQPEGEHLPVAPEA